MAENHVLPAPEFSWPFPRGLSRTKELRSGSPCSRTWGQARLPTCKLKGQPLEGVGAEAGEPFPPLLSCLHLATARPLTAPPPGRNTQSILSDNRPRATEVRPQHRTGLSRGPHQGPPLGVLVGCCQRNAVASSGGAEVGDHGFTCKRPCLKKLEALLKSL